MNRTIYGLWVGCLLLAGCTQELSLANAGSETPLHIASVQPDLLSGSSGQVTTRANDAIEVNGAQMGLFVKANGSYYAEIKNRPYVFQTGGGWQPAGGEANTIWLNHADAVMAACYPYAAGLPQVAGQVGVVNLTAALRSTVAPQELWYKDFSANNRSGGVTMTLKQAYCRIKITYTLAQDLSYRVEPSVYKLTVSGGRSGGSATDGIFSTSTLDMFTGTYTRGGVNTVTAVDVSAAADAYPVKKAVADTKAVFDVLLIPAALTDKVTLTAVIGGSTLNTDTKTMKVDIPAFAFGKGTADAGKLVAGNVYNVAVTVKGQDAIGSASVTTENWAQTVVQGTGTTVDGDRYFDIVTEESHPGDIGGDECTAEVRLILSKLTWASGNLKGSTTDPYFTMDTPTGYGHYYTWTPGNLCAKLDPSYGTGWRIPSKQELVYLARCASKSSPLDEKDGVKGMWFMNSDIGLFLPAAGFRNRDEGAGSTPLRDPGVAAFYWSDAHNGGDRAYVLELRSGYATTLYANPKSSGHSIRCVK